MNIKMENFAPDCPNPPFKMVILYEDPKAVGQAGAFQKFLREGCLKDVEIKESIWNFAWLGHPRLREQAAKAAGEADMIVISARETTILPEHFRIWIKSCRAYKQDVKSALVALLSQECAAHPRSEFLDHSLRSMAEEYGMEFFCTKVAGETAGSSRF